MEFCTTYTNGHLHIKIFVALLPTFYYLLMIASNSLYPNSYRYQQLGAGHRKFSGELRKNFLCSAANFLCSAGTFYARLKNADIQKINCWLTDDSSLTDDSYKSLHLYINSNWGGVGREGDAV